MLEVTAEAIDDFVLLRRTKLFYLRDIGKLDENKEKRKQLSGRLPAISQQSLKKTIRKEVNFI